MDKSHLHQQLLEKFRHQSELAKQIAIDAQREAKSGAQRAVNIAKGHSQRMVVTHEMLSALETFRPQSLKKGERIGLGAVVEVEEENGELGRTLFIAPVGAGEELVGPDGDGVFQVVTPQSPFGKALMGKKVGDEVEVLIAGDATGWTITYAC